MSESNPVDAPRDEVGESTAIKPIEPTIYSTADVLQSFRPLKQETA